MISTAKVFPNESRDMDILVVEVLTKKMSFSECKTLLAPLIALSSTLIINCGDEDLVSALNTSLPLLASLKEVFEVKEEEASAPRVCFVSGNEKVQKMVAKAVGGV